MVSTNPVLFDISHLSHCAILFILLCLIVWYSWRQNKKNILSIAFTYNRNVQLRLSGWVNTDALVGYAPSWGLETFLRINYTFSFYKTKDFVPNVSPPPSLPLYVGPLIKNYFFCVCLLLIRFSFLLFSRGVMVASVKKIRGCVTLGTNSWDSGEPSKKTFLANMSTLMRGRGSLVSLRKMVF